MEDWTTEFGRENSTEKSPSQRCLLYQMKVCAMFFSVADECVQQTQSESGRFVRNLLYRLQTNRSLPITNLTYTPASSQWIFIRLYCFTGKNLITLHISKSVLLCCYIDRRSLFRVWFGFIAYQSFRLFNTKYIFIHKKQFYFKQFSLH